MQPIKLINLSVDEVSLVKSPANRRRFILWKNKKEEEDSNMEEIIVKANDSMKKILHKLSEQDVESLKKTMSELDTIVEKAELSSEDRDLIFAAMKLLGSLENDFPKELAEKLAMFLGAEESTGEKLPEPEPVTEEKAGENMNKNQTSPSLTADEILKGATPDFSAMPTEARGVLEALWKSSKESMKKATQLEADLQKSKDALKMREYIEKAQVYKELPMTPEKLGKILKNISESNPEIMEDVKRIFKAGCDAIRTSKFQRYGSARSDSGIGSGAWNQIEQKAREIVQKSNHEMSFEKAISLVVKNEPDLYREYLEEKKQ